MNHYGIIGDGPIGAYFAAHLKQAGYPVSWALRDLDKFNCLKRQPLILRGKTSVQVQMTDLYLNLKDFIESGSDIVLLCVKSYDSLPVLQQIHAYKPKKNIVFVSCQNGIDVEDPIAQIFGLNLTLRMVLNLGCNFVSPSEVSVAFLSEHFLSEIGEASGRVGKDLNQAGIKTKLTKTYKEEAFKKAILNSALSTVCALTRQTMKNALETAEVASLVKAVVLESIQIAQALSYSIQDDFLAEAVTYLSKGGDHKPSMLIDIEQARPTENTYHCGKLLAYAKKHGIKTPVIETLHGLIQGLELAITLEKKKGAEYE